MTSLIKIFYNNNIFHKNIECKKKCNLINIRFTKVLTKYSTEYNNRLFIQDLCELFNFDKKDIFTFFFKLREEKSLNEIYTMLEHYDIGKLDINRIYRYIDKLLLDTIDDNNNLETYNS